MGKYSVLCLNGGGVRGSLQVGALAEYGELDFQDGVYGISIGAVLASLIAFGFTIPELTHMCKTYLYLDTLLDVPRLEALVQLPTAMGLDSGERAHSTLREIFATKGLNLDTLTVGDADLPLYIVASDLTHYKSIVFNVTVPLWDAIRSSIALPVIFTPHIIRGRTFVDGGVLCKNISKHVPGPHRAKALYLLCNNSPTITTFPSFLHTVIHAPTVQEFAGLQKSYPQNVCIITESTTDMLDIRPDVDYLLECGRLSYRGFLAKSGS